MLLEQSSVNPDTPDTKYGQTPLWRAAANGNEGIVKMLLQRNDVNPDKPDRWGQTPLSSAVRNGYEGIVRMFSSLNPDEGDT